MAWQVAVVVDAETEVEPLLGMMPVWAVSTPARKAAAPELWKNWNGAWANDPALTIWSAPWGENVLARLVNEIPTVGMHYQRVAYLRLFRIQTSFWMAWPAWAISRYRARPIRVLVLRSQSTRCRTCLFLLWTPHLGAHGMTSSPTYFTRLARRNGMVAILTR